MNTKFLKIINTCFAAIIVILGVISFIVPAYSYTVSGTTTKYYLFEIIGVSMLSNLSYLGAIVVAAILLVLPLLTLSNNKMVNYVSLGTSIALLGFAIYLSKLFEKYYDAGKPGTILFLISAIALVVLTIFNFIVLNFGESLKKLAGSKKSIKDLLEENESLYKEKLISEEEYNARRNEILK